jgi:FlaA1/EpsC-like NDP-sugar epimerase
MKYMFAQFRNPRLYVLLLIDAVIFATAPVLACLLRFECGLNSPEIERIGALLPYLISCKLGVFFLFGLYKGMWRYSSLDDFWRLAQASFVSSLFAMAIPRFVHFSSGFSRAVFVLDGLLTFLIVGCVRIGIRTCYIARGNMSRKPGFCFSAFRGNGSRKVKRILIIGAGNSGDQLLRETYNYPVLGYKAVGFLDDDPGKRDRAIHGVPIFGGVDLLPQVLKPYRVDEIIISIPSATGSEMRRIVEICQNSGTLYKTLPAISQILDGGVNIKTLRDVSYEDLLRRDPVQLDMAGIRNYLTGKTVMVTGAGGSIGSELCRQLVRFDPALFVLVDSGESNLYGIQMELQHELHHENHCCILCHVQDEPLMEQVFRHHRPDIVFHAAAYKHVPLLERNPWEAVFNNVKGSSVVMEMAAKYGVDRVVLVSTDKAVRPTNVMGTSKRLTELIMQSMQKTDTRFMAVRFGNVVGSSGSVVPLFRRQIEKGGPLTVTHPDVTRFFMTIPESAQLILQAGALGKGGEIFVLEMGKPLRIADIAEDLIRLSGKEPGKDVEIVFTGLREGEKLYEELITGGEDVIGTKHEKIMVLKANGRWNWNGRGTRDHYCKWLDAELKELYRIAASHDASAIKQKLREIVPEYMPQSAEPVVKLGQACDCDVTLKIGSPRARGLRADKR